MTVEPGYDIQLVGPVAETHDLLYDSPLAIADETILPIRHCLVGPEFVEEPVHPQQLGQGDGECCSRITDLKAERNRMQ